MSGLLLLALVGCDGLPTDLGDGLLPPQVTEDATPERDPVETVLDDEAYRFCHEPGVDKTQAQRFCPLLEGLPEDRCPGLRASCEDDAVEEIHSLPATGCNPEQQGGGDAFSGAPEPPDPQEFDYQGCQMPDTGLGGLLEALLKWGMAALVAVLVLVLLRLMFLFLGRRRPMETEVDVVPVVITPEEEGLDDVPDLPVADLLAAARAALERGAPGEAVVLARGAVLRNLRDREILRLHRSRTDREYLRDASRNGVDRADLQEVLNSVEAHRFGGEPVTQAWATRVLGAAQKLIVMATLLLVAGLAQGQEVSRHGPLGDVGLHAVFAKYGHDASWRSQPLVQLDDDTDPDSVLVLDLSWVAPSEQAWTAVEDWVDRGGVLVVTGNGDEVFPQLGTLGVPSGTVLKRGEAVALTWLPVPKWSDSPPGVYENTEGEPWIVTDEGEPTVVVLSMGAGHVVGVSDASMMYNGALVAPQNEAFWGEVLQVLQARTGALPTPIPVELATTSAAAATGEQTSPSESLANARLLPFVLQLLLLWVVIGLWKGWPFGPLRDPPEEGRTAFVDHVRALGRRYSRTADSRYAASVVAQLWVGRLGPAGLELAALRSGMDGEQAKAWVDEVTRLAESPNAGPSDRDWTLLEELWKVTRT